MRRSTRLTQNQANTKKDAQMGPKLKKIRLENKTSNIATLDNDAMVETLKYLNYMELAKSSLVAKRFSNLINTHRHSLALLDIEHLYMECFNDPTVMAAVKIFNKELSPGAYTEWVVQNSYSRKIIHEGRVVKMQYVNQCSNEIRTAFFARKELNHKNWPVFQHFVCLLTDPFVYIRLLNLTPRIDITFLNLLAGTSILYQKRLQCDQFGFYRQGNAQKLIGWIKNYVQCNELRFCYLGSNYDEALLDFAVTGAHCTSAINFNHCDVSNVIVGFSQKFMDLKSCDETQMVEFIRSSSKGRVVEFLKANYAKFIVKEEKCKGLTVKFVCELINNDIGKQLQITGDAIGNLLLEIKNL